MQIGEEEEMRKKGDGWPTGVRDRARALVRRTGANCHICGEPIDYSLKSPHPMSFELDHKISMAVDPSLASVPSNWAASHRKCNRAKSDKPHADIIRRSGALK